MTRAEAGLPRWTPPANLTAQQTERLNALASVIAGVIGDDSYVPLSVRYCAAADALAVIEQWEVTGWPRALWPFGRWVNRHRCPFTGRWHWREFGG